MSIPGRADAKARISRKENLKTILSTALGTVQTVNAGIVESRYEGALRRVGIVRKRKALEFEVLKIR